MDTSQFAEQINSGDIDSLFKFNDEIARTEVNFESFLRRLSKMMQEQGIKFLYDAEKAWRSFKWKTNDFSIRSSLPEIENAIRSQMSRNEEEMKVQQDEYLRKANYVHEVRKIKENPLNKPVNEIIVPDKKFDKTDEREQTVFIQILTTKKDQVLYLRDNYKNMITDADGNSVDAVCANSLQQCNVKQEYLNANKEFRCLRLLVMKEQKKKVCEKLKGKGFVVKDLIPENNQMNDAISKTSKEDLQILESELSEMKHTHENFLKDIYVSSYEIYMHIKFLKLFVESKLTGGYNDQDQQQCIVPTKSEDKFKQILTKGYDDDDATMILIMMPDF